MLLFQLCLKQLGNVSRMGLQKVISLRTISRASAWFENLNELEIEKNVPNLASKIDIVNLSDRSLEIPVELSIKYLQSDAYKTTYGKDPVWKLYRRNFKGQYIPPKTRKTCIRNNIITTSNPCPICRDQYLILDYRNVSLIKQFISSLNGEIISYKKTGICQKQHKNLLVAIFNAKDYGTITFDVPFRTYDYSEWYTDINKEKE